MSGSVRMPQFSERSTIVLDIGQRFTKLGFAGEFSPRFIIRTELPDEPGVSLFDAGSTHQQNVARVKKFLHYLYYNYLLVVPKERRVVLVESVLRATAERNVLASLLFDTFNVPSILFAPTHLLATMPFKTQTALVIEVGNRESLVMPISEGVAMLNCWESSPTGGSLTLETLRQALIDQATIKSAPESMDVKAYIGALTSDTIEDVLVRCCFVTKMARGRSYHSDPAQPAQPAVPDVEFPLEDGHFLIVPGSVRESAYECLFHSGGDDRKTLPQLVLDSVLRCPIDLRKPMMERLLLIGGCPMAIGFMARLKSELLDLLASDKYSARLPMRTVKFFLLDQENMFNYLGWLGGSLFGATEILTYRSLSRETWLKTHHLQDWTDKIVEHYAAMELSADAVEKKG